MKLFPATLVINPSATDLMTLITQNGHQIINNPDLFEVSEYKIAVIRQISKFLSQKPISHSTKIVLIQKAEDLQTESQNALLKNLEEPGENNYFILTTNHPNSLLPTIISRCQLINYHDTATTSFPLLTPSKELGVRLMQSENLVNGREGTISYLECQLRLYQTKLILEPNLTNQQFIKKIIKTISLIKANIDHKTALDFLLLS
jgi:hypothetical protein